MAVYERTVHVDAPLERVWDFHSTIDGLLALTPAWFNLRVESLSGPGDGPDPEVLKEGSEIELSVRPLGVPPRQSWTSVIVARDFGAESAMFRDEMRDGPFRRWVHTHRFYREDGGTRIVDRVEYELPVGPLVGVSGVAGVFLDPMFRYRHRRTKALLE